MTHTFTGDASIYDPTYNLRKMLGINRKFYSVFLISRDLDILNKYLFNTERDIVNTVKKEVPSNSLDDIYRVELFGNGKVVVICFGMDAFDDPLEGEYDSVDSLPQWLQERLAVLSMLPVADNQVVAGVGRKISDTIYWANKPTM